MSSKYYHRVTVRTGVNLSRILGVLDGRYPNPKTTLNHSSALELLVATILSAQTTDNLVNRVTVPLFAKYRTAKDYARTAPAKLARDIKSVNFFRTKAKNIVGACRMICEKFGGDVPSAMEDLTQLPGVSRKTANVVLGSWFEKAEGVVVDTHVMRVAQRLGLTKNKVREKIEQDLMAQLPRERWTPFSFQLIEHGRALCKARAPKCPECPLNAECPSAQI